jgi:hypothetical protein
MKTLASRIAKALLLGAVLAGAAGCSTQMLAYLMATFAPPEKIKAVYEPPKGKKYLVFVDDRPAPVSWEPIKQELATRIGQKLQEKKFASSLVAYERIQDLTSGRDFDKMSIAEAGQKLGADVVLYVQIDYFALREAPESPLWQGRLATSVWMVDARSPQRLWPKDVPIGTGYQVPPVDTKPAEHPSPSYGELVAKDLAEQMADRIVKLFYDHEEERYPDYDKRGRSPD